jgi:hypothetical protein
VNGVGLVYQRDFDTFGEFLRNIFHANNRKQPITPSPEPKNPAPGTQPNRTGGVSAATNEGDNQ